MVDENDQLYRLASTKFDQMLRNPASQCFPQFAGHRVRLANIIVELSGQKPIKVVRITFDILTFGDMGHFDSRTFNRHQFARAEQALAPVLAVSKGQGRVVEAASRFTEQGGRWLPSGTVARAVEDAAMGRIKCPRL